ncbi:hypothetical protein LR48_Vigan10g200700 [Vigna angularis]|uniref:Uncharacterized protein n=1 Tax=Phaseolus angularis TaxID=3914 RepID=A0A0L9VM39_PHAAN|nr:hypothetical protein LR48_Vigan10g200700 [Vigna angularis]
MHRKALLPHVVQIFMGGFQMMEGMRNICKCGKNRRRPASLATSRALLSRFVKKDGVLMSWVEEEHDGRRIEVEDGDGHGLVDVKVAKKKKGVGRGPKTVKEEAWDDL